MIDFGKIVYLDVQKTGSSSVKRFLRANLDLPERAHRLHAPAEAYRPDSFYFTSVRNPLAMYASLFQYGLQGRGGLVSRFRAAGLAGIYQPDTAGFERWLGYILAPENVGLFGAQRRNTLPEMIGLQSYRFLKLSFVNPAALLQSITTKAQLRTVYRQKKLHSLVLKTETLNQGLENLLNSEVGPFFTSRKQVICYLENAKRAKQSKPVAEFQAANISPDLKYELKQREWFLYEEFYP